MERGVDAVKLTKDTTVEAAVSVFAREGRMVWAARDSAQIGITGDGGTVTRPLIVIDPETGLPEEEPVAAQWFKAGGVVAGAPIKPR